MADQPLTLRDIALKASDRFGGARGRALGREAEKAGVKIVYTTIDKIIAGTYRSVPKPETLNALAKLAGMDPEQVYAAADVPMPGPPFADELPPNTDQLRPHERRAVIEVIRAFLSSHELERRIDLSWADREGLSVVADAIGTSVDDLLDARAAADRGRPSGGQQRRTDADRAGEPETNDPEDLEPR